MAPLEQTCSRKNLLRTALLCTALTKNVKGDVDPLSELRQKSRRAERPCYAGVGDVGGAGGSGGG